MLLTSWLSVRPRPHQRRRPGRPGRPSRLAAAEQLESRTLLTGAITGAVYSDADADGVRDAGESGVSGLTVYVDSDRDGTRDGGEAAATSDGAGVYTFNGLAAGEYVVRAFAPSGFTVTAPEPPADFFYAIDGTSSYTGGSGADNRLIKIDAATGAVTTVGTLGVPIHGLVQTNDGRLFGITDDPDPDRLWSINPQTGVATLIGNAGAELGRDLTYDAATDTIYAVGDVGESGSYRLGTFDRSTGGFTPIAGATPISRNTLTGTPGLAFDPVNNRIIAYEFDGQIWEFTTGGAARILSTVAAGLGRSLTHDGQRFVMKADGAAQGQRLLVIDPDAGTVTPSTAVAPAVPFTEALEYVASPGRAHVVTVADGATAAGIDFGVVRPISLTVDVLADEDDGNYVAGDLSLREAVKLVADGGVVTFAVGLAGGTITLDGREIVLDRDLTIAGLGATQLAISGNNASRIFSVTLDATVALSGLTLTRGTAPRLMNAGGAIFNAGTLTVTASILRANAAGDGGAIFNQEGALLTLDASEISANTVGNYGGAVFNRGTLAVSNSSLSGNSAGNGGAIFNTSDAEASLTNTALATNTATSLIYGGGAIVNHGELTVVDSDITGNSATRASGGGIYNGFRLTVVGSNISENRAFATDWNSRTPGGGGIYNEGRWVTLVGTSFVANRSEAVGGGFASEWGSIVITDCTFSDNSARDGGGLWVGAIDATISGTTITRNTARDGSGGGLVVWGPTLITDSVISENFAEGFAGGIDVLGPAVIRRTAITGNTALHGAGIYVSEAGLELSDSTVSGNSARENGGGIISGQSTLTMSNVTLSGNSAAVDGGGLIVARGVATLRNVTVFGNRSDSDGNGTGTGGGIGVREASPLLYNTLVAGNLRGTGAESPDDVSGSLAAASSHNLITATATAGGLTNGVNNNIVGVNWTTVLDPVLRDNGGPTLTHALLRGGAAIDAGSNAEAVDAQGNPLAFDQRGTGFPRILRGTADIGAFELANSNPVAKNDAFSATEDAPQTAGVFADNGSGADSDPDGDPFTVVAVNGVPANVGATITLASGALLTVNADGTFTYDPNGGFESLAVGETATETFTYTISDGFGGESTATVTLTINGVNDDPVTSDVTVTTQSPTTVNGQVTATDPEDDPLTFALGVSPAHGVALVNANGTFTYTPNYGFSGSDSFTVTVSDGRGGTAVSTVSVQVTRNFAPVTGRDFVRVREDHTVTFNVLANDSDPEGGPLHIALPAGPPFGTWVTLDSGARLKREYDGTFTYDTNGAFSRLLPGESVVERLSYFASDAAGVFEMGFIELTVFGRGGADLVGYIDGEWWATTSGGVTTHVWARWNDAPWDALRMGDVNAEGYADIVGLIDGVWYVGLHVAAGFATSAASVWSNHDWRDVTVRDVNGDGKADLLARVGGEWWVALSESTHLDTAFATPTRWATWANASWKVVFVDDLNADGRGDLLGYLNGEWWAALSNGAGFDAAARWAVWSGAAWDAVGTFDANADGRADLYALFGNEWYVASGIGSGFITVLRDRWAGVEWRDVRVGDFDGDGFDDLAARYQGEWYVGYTGLFSIEPREVALFARWADAEWRNVRAADFDGDGRADLIGRLDGQWWLSGSSSDGLATNRLWATWAELDWQAVSAVDIDGGDFPLSNQTSGLVLIDEGARRLGAASDETQAAFWSQTDDDDELAGLLAGAY